MALFNVTVKLYFGAGEIIIKNINAKNEEEAEKYIEEIGLREIIHKLDNNYYRYETKMTMSI